MQPNNSKTKEPSTKLLLHWLRISFLDMSFDQKHSLETLLLQQLCFILLTKQPPTRATIWREALEEQERILP